jgi:hypothetical protein
MHHAVICKGRMRSLAGGHLLVRMLSQRRQVESSARRICFASSVPAAGPVVRAGNVQPTPREPCGASESRSWHHTEGVGRASRFDENTRGVEGEGEHTVHMVAVRQHILRVHHCVARVAVQWRHRRCGRLTAHWQPVLRALSQRACTTLPLPLRLALCHHPRSVVYGAQDSTY